MKLYYTPGACSLASHIALIEAGLPHTLEKVDLKSKQTAEGANFLDICDKGYVPVLELDNGEILSEGVAILQYLADLKPAANLAPAVGTFERVRLQEWLTFINSEVHKTIGGLFAGPSGEARDALMMRIEAKLAWLDKNLAGKDYCLGASYSVADAYLFVVIGWLRMFKVSLDAYPNLVKVLGHVAARPAVQAAMQAEGLRS